MKHRNIILIGLTILFFGLLYINHYHFITHDIGYLENKEMKQYNYKNNYANEISKFSIIRPDSSMITIRSDSSKNIYLYKVARGFYVLDMHQKQITREYILKTGRTNSSNIAYLSNLIIINHDQ